MQLIRKSGELKEALGSVRSIGFTPTMGALHEGHLSLLRRSRAENDLSVLSIFVNPTQFSVEADVLKYPRAFEEDVDAAGGLCDIIFAPSAYEMYGASGSDRTKVMAAKSFSSTLEGAFRPGHFDGVLEVLSKFFNLIRPKKAYFGRKDAQQLLCVKRMVRDLFLNIEIIECETIRDHDGLALSSRNVFLSPDDRRRALIIPKTLLRLESLLPTLGAEGREEALSEAREELKAHVELNYFELVSRGGGQSEPMIPTLSLSYSILLLAAKVGEVRLLDNIFFNEA